MLHNLRGNHCNLTISVTIIETWHCRATDCPKRVEFYMNFSTLQPIDTISHSENVDLHRKSFYSVRQYIFHPKTFRLGLIVPLVKYKNNSNDNNLEPCTVQMQDFENLLAYRKGLFKKKKTHTHVHVTDTMNI